MPITFAALGERCVVQKIGGSGKLKRHLESLGFVQGEVVTVISRIAGDCILQIKDSRIAVNQELASKILV